MATNPPKLGIAIVDPPSPQNPVAVQARINPEKVGLAANDVRDSDFFVPPFCPVFVKAKVSTSPYAAQYATKKSMREGLVHDAVCNFYDNNDVAAARFGADSLRFIGVSYDGIADMKGAQMHPDSIGRFSVVVSGAVTIAVNPDDMKGANIGDVLRWDDKCNKLCYPTYPADFSPVRVFVDNAASGKNVIGSVIGFNATKNEVRVLLMPECTEFNHEIDFDGATPADEKQTYISGVLDQVKRQIAIVRGVLDRLPTMPPGAKFALDNAEELLSEGQTKLVGAVVQMNPTAAQVADEPVAAAAPAASSTSGDADGEKKTKRRRTKGKAGEAYETYEG